MALLVMTFALGAGVVTAQDEEAPTSVMSPLADRSLILDVLWLEERLI